MKRLNKKSQQILNNLLTFGTQKSIIKLQSRETEMSKAASAGKEKTMDEEMNVGELLKETAEENQTRKILEILNECKDLEEAKEKVKALLNK
ncbi:MAG: hypothetical protein LUG26_07825 [Ruminococcus sp.]|nr:hypothetical protein [Ruminococcus sp.]